MDLVDVGPLTRRAPLARVLEIVDVRVVDPLAVEGDHRIGDRAVAALDEQFLAAVRVQQHQVGPRLQRDGGGEVGVEALVDLVAGPRSADVDDVVIVLDRPVGRDVRHLNVDRVEVSLLLAFLAQKSGQAQRQECEQGEETDRPAEGRHGGSPAGESAAIPADTPIMARSCGKATFSWRWFPICPIGWRSGVVPWCRNVNIPRRAEKQLYTSASSGKLSNKRKEADRPEYAARSDTRISMVSAASRREQDLGITYGSTRTFPSPNCRWHCL